MPYCWDEPLEESAEAGPVAALDPNEDVFPDALDDPIDVERLALPEGPVIEIDLPERDAPLSVEMAAGPAERAAEITEIAELYLSGTLDPAMKAAAEDFLVAALDDPAIRVREAMATAFAASAATPHQIALALSQDVPRVATIMLRETPCLLDIELLDIARTAGTDVLHALAARRAASVNLVLRLVDRADLALARRLAENRALPLQGAALDRLVSAHGMDPGLREALLTRPGLPAAIRLRLVEMAGARLVDGLAALNFGRKDTLAETAAHATTLAALEISETDEAGAAALVQALQAKGRLTPKLVLRAACEGRIAFLLAALSRLSGASEGRIASLLSARRSGPLDALCRRSGLPS
ncbi:MAG: DUF2336 domain-containing protein, partial [Pseudomonadota bacterium]